MRAYARLEDPATNSAPMPSTASDVFTMEQALERMRHLIGFAGEWTSLLEFPARGLGGGGERGRSATAATFAATLELAKQGRVEIRQAETFRPIAIRRRPGQDGPKTS